MAIPESNKEADHDGTVAILPSRHPEIARLPSDSISSVSESFWIYSPIRFTRSRSSSKSHSFRRGEGMPHVRCAPTGPFEAVAADIANNAEAARSAPM